MLGTYKKIDPDAKFVTTIDVNKRQNSIKYECNSTVNLNNINNNNDEKASDDDRKVEVVEDTIAASEVTTIESGIPSSINGNHQLSSDIGGGSVEEPLPAPTPETREDDVINIITEDDESEDEDTTDDPHRMSCKCR